MNSNPNDAPGIADAEGPREGRHGCCHGRAPWPVAAAAVGGAFYLFPPLGIAGLAYLAMRHRHGCGRGHGEERGFRGFRGGRRGRFSSGNVAFDEARAEAWRALEEEAVAFDDFRRRERTARDREVYDRFRSERRSPPATSERPGEPA